MMSKLLNKRLWPLAGAVLISALAFFSIWLLFNRQPVIEIRVGKSERAVALEVETHDDIKAGLDEQICYFVEPNFQLRWMHSVEKQWWEEQYQRQDGELLLTTTYFEAFGAGTPSTETLASIQKPGYIGYEINEQLPHLNWVVSRLTKGEINYANHRVLIHQWLPDYSEVTITPKMYSLIDRFKKDFCHELPSNREY